MARWWEAERATQVVFTGLTREASEASVDVHERHPGELVNAVELGHSRGVIEDRRSIVRLGGERVALRDGHRALKRVAKAIGAGGRWRQQVQQHEAHDHQPTELRHRSPCG